MKHIPLGASLKIPRVELLGIFLLSSLLGFSTDFAQQPPAPSSQSLASASAMIAQRRVIPIEQGWLFLKGDADIASSSADWKKVSVPHTWNTIDYFIF